MWYRITIKEKKRLLQASFLFGQTHSTIYVEDYQDTDLKKPDLYSVSNTFKVYLLRLFLPSSKDCI